MDFGGELRRARELKGVSLREIAESTKISARALDALERNDISRLPGGIFTRAIVRAYAAEVGLDPDQAMRGFTEQFPGAVGSWSPGQTDDNFETRRQTAGLMAAIAALAIALGVGFFFWNAQPQRTAFPARPPVDDAVAPTTGPPAPREAPPAAGPPFDRPAPAAPAPAPAVEPPPEHPESLTIALNPSGPCWISVIADGQRIFARELAPGESETTTATRELVISAGDAASFRFSITGHPGRVVGKPGEVVTIRITPENYRTFLAVPSG
jgi:cytoskeletal protein RodZ